MSKPHFVKLEEAAIMLGTTKNNLMVTACVHKKQHSEYPTWYSSNGERGAKRSYVDVGLLTGIRQREIDLHHKSCELYYDLIEGKGIKRSRLGVALAKNSTLYPKETIWRMFITRQLFREPSVRFVTSLTRLQEFYRITKGIADGTIHA